MAGDIIGAPASAGDEVLCIIMDYLPSSDEYVRTRIYKNSDGTWGHRIDSSTEKISRKVIEKTYPSRVTHISIASVPVATPTTVAPATTTYPDVTPVVTGILPGLGGTGELTNVIIAGSNFLPGATARILMPGYPPIQGTALSIASNQVQCVFDLKGAPKGTYHVIVTNPGGQSDMLIGGFHVGEPAPVIAGVNPMSIAINQTLGLTIGGQNFKDAVRVTISRGSREIICLSPSVTNPNTILCKLGIPAGTTPGEWNLTVTNLEDQKKGTWNHPVIVMLNAT